MTVKVYPCGTKVTTVLSSVEGIITATSIRFKAISYEVSYFLNGEYKAIWLNDQEFTVTSKARNTIGFITNQK